MDNFCVCCGDIIPEGRMVCPMCEMAAEEGNVVCRMGGEEYGGRCTQKNRRKTGRNGKTAVCHLFKRKEV